MTYLSIVSPLTSGVGKVELGDQNLTELTVGDIKDKIETRHVKTPANKQKLWWMGYLLDDDSLSIEKACVGKEWMHSYFPVSLVGAIVLSPSFVTLSIFLSTPRFRR
mmetsp:Transcript_13644/g.19082  ORF Transcript_13644/g.19082 Transcript_13644/m.19082 type:complete len:107 (+) Transcript_13644:163-483(+)